MSEEKDINSILEHIQKNVSKGQARSGNDIVSLLKSSNTVLKDIKKINEVSSNKSNVFLKDISKNVENFVSGKSKLFFSGMIKVLNEFYTKQEKKTKLAEEVKPKKEKVSNVKYAESTKQDTETKSSESPKILKYQVEKKQEQKQNKTEMTALLASNANLAKSVFTVQKILLGILQNTSTKAISGTSVTIVPIREKEEKTSDELGFKSLLQDVRIIKISLLGLISSFKTDRLADTEIRREKPFNKNATSVPPIDRNIKNKTDDRSSDGGLFDMVGGISSALVGSLAKLGSLVTSGVSSAVGGLGLALKEGLAGIAGLFTGGLIGIVRGVGSAIASGALLTILPGILAGLGLAGIAYMAKKAYDMYTETEQLKKDTETEYGRQKTQRKKYRVINDNDPNKPDDQKSNDRSQIDVMDTRNDSREIIEKNTQKIKNLTRLISNSKAKGISLDYEKLEKEKEQLQQEIDAAKQKENSVYYNIIKEKNKDVLGENPYFLSIEKPRAYGFSEVISGKKDTERSELISGMQQNALNKNIAQPIVVSNAPVSNISTSTQETNNLLPMAYRDPSYIQQYKWYGNYGSK